MPACKYLLITHTLIMSQLYLTIHSLQAPLHPQHPPLRLLLTPHSLPPTSLPARLATTPHTHYSISTVIKIAFSEPEPPQLRLHVLAVQQHSVSSVGSALLPIESTGDKKVEIEPYGFLECSVSNEPLNRHVDEEYFLGGPQFLTQTLSHPIEEDSEVHELGGKLARISQSLDFRKKEEPLISCGASPEIQEVELQLERQQQLNTLYRKDLERHSEFQRRIKERLSALKS